MTECPQWTQELKPRASTRILTSTRQFIRSVRSHLLGRRLAGRSSGRIPTTTARPPKRFKPGRLTKRAVSQVKALRSDEHGVRFTRTSRPMQQVHCRRSNESCDENIRRPVVEHLRRITLLENSCHAEPPPGALTSWPRSDRVSRKESLHQFVSGRAPPRRASERAVLRQGWREVRPSRTHSVHERLHDPWRLADVDHPRVAGLPVKPFGYSEYLRCSRQLAARLSALEHFLHPQRKANILCDVHVGIEGVALKDHCDIAFLRRHIVDDPSPN